MEPLVFADSDSAVVAVVAVAEHLEKLQQVVAAVVAVLVEATVCLAALNFPLPV